MTNGLVLTHGAGGNRNTPLLVRVDEAFTAAGWTVERVDLAFRQARASGPPRPSDAARDRESLATAIAAMRTRCTGRVVVGGASYGGRQASLLLAERALADALLLLSYPLHPPGKPDQKRTAHFPSVTVPALFVHGTKDPFGTIEEIEAARALLGGPSQVSVVEAAGHDLARGRFDVPARIVAPLAQLIG